MKFALVIFLFFSSTCFGQTTNDSNTDIEHLREKAWNKYSKDQYDSALFYYNKLLVLQPNNARNYFDRGNCYQAYYKYYLAVKDFETGRLIDSSDFQPYYQGAICKFNLTNYKEALEDITKAIKLNPEFTDGYYLRIDINFKLNNYDDVLKDCNQVIRQDTSDYSYSVYAYLGKLYFKLKDYKKSLTFLDKALKLQPKNALAYYYRGRCKIETKMQEQGYDDITKAYELYKNIDTEILLLNNDW